MKLKTALLAAALTVSATGLANAQMFGMGAPGDGITPRSQNEMMMGPYVGLGGGANWVQSSRMTEPNIPFDNGNVGFNTGWGFNGAIGYAFGFGPRLEIEGSYRRNRMNDEINGGSCDGSSIDDASRLDQLGIMANAAYDIYTGTRFVPYVGGGIGASRTRLKIGTCETNVNEAQWRFAVQGFAGVDFLATQALRVGLRYTFMHTNDLENLRNTCACSPFSGNVDLDPNNHAVTLQVAYNFGAPRVIAAAPAPVAAPAPALQRNFLVFFDFDKSDITPEADRVIVQAANNAKTASVTRITLTGHTDRAGPVAYNQRLSERRADAVKARLVREGVAASSIVTIGRGESSTLVPTADGVREPQNRRVEIVL